MAVLRERLSTWSLFRLREGYTTTGLSTFWMGGRNFGRPVASFSLGPGINVPEDSFDSRLLFHNLILFRNCCNEEVSLASQLRVVFEEKFVRIPYPLHADYNFRRRRLNLSDHPRDSLMRRSFMLRVRVTWMHSLTSPFTLFRYLAICSFFTIRVLSPFIFTVPHVTALGSD
ncbi:hypothetical protein DFH29DRAFT_53840 [Suillus ampliporus]|nr:hypothetical protein DFH29DRAFT_53840 [Suillus ampliporus]